MQGIYIVDHAKACSILLLSKSFTCISLLHHSSYRNCKTLETSRSVRDVDLYRGLDVFPDQNLRIVESVKGFGLNVIDGIGSRPGGLIPVARLKE